MTPSLLLALAVTSSTSTAATYQRAAVGWEVAAEDTLGALDVCNARLDFEKAAANTIALEADLTVEKLRAENLRLQADLVEAQARQAMNVPKWRRNIQVVGAVVCTLGAGVAITAGIWGPTERARRVLGIGGGALAVGGCVTTVIAW